MQADREVNKANAGEGAPLPVDAPRMYTERAASYHFFVRSVRYPQGLQAYFRSCPALGPDMRVLDAGCGSGIVTFALHDAMVSCGLTPAALHAFDLTPAMLDRFARALDERQDMPTVERVRANVLEPDQWPADWIDHDLIVTASMLEYIPKSELPRALSGLRERLAPGGRLVLFITQDNALMRPLVGRWWDSNLYTRAELAAAFAEAGFPDVVFDRFPPAYAHLNLWGHIVRTAI